jgi:hypothetical protein
VRAPRPGEVVGCAPCNCAHSAAGGRRVCAADGAGIIAWAAEIPPPRTNSGPRFAIEQHVASRRVRLSHPLPAIPTSPGDRIPLARYTRINSAPFRSLRQTNVSTSPRTLSPRILSPILLASCSACRSRYVNPSLKNTKQTQSAVKSNKTLPVEKVQNKANPNRAASPSIAIGNVILCPAQEIGV